MAYGNLLLNARFDEDAEASLFDLSPDQLAAFREQLQEARVLWLQATDGDEEFHVKEIDLVERNLERIDAELMRRQLPAAAPVSRLTTPSTQSAT